MRLRFVLFIAAFLLLAPSRFMYAQTGIYVQFTGQSNNLSSTGWFVGPTFGFYQDRRSFGPVHLGYDFRGAILTHSSQQYDSGLGGARLSLVPHVLPFKVYAEGLGGVGFINAGNNNNSTHFQYQVNGGVEYTVLPRIDWRVVEVAYNGFSGNTGSNPVGFSSGIVVRLR